MSRASTDSAMPRSLSSLERVLPTHHGALVQAGLVVWRVRRSRGTHVRGASCAASVAIMRTALSVEWTRYGVVDPSARRQCQRLCTASRVDRSRQRQSEPRSAVLAALPQLQGPTEVPKPKYAASGGPLSPDGGRRACRQQRHERLAPAIKVWKTAILSIRE